MKEVEERLWQLTVDELKVHCKKLGIKAGGIKQDTIERILVFYHQENWLEEYFASLEGFDKEYTYLLVQQNFVPISSEVRSLRKKYNIKSSSWYYDEFEDPLKFSLKGFIPTIFREKLLQLVPPIKEEFYGIDAIDESDCFAIIKSKDPMKKFDDFLKFITTNKVKVTDKTSMVTKANILKFYNSYQVEDVIRREDDEELKTQNDTILIHGVVTLLLASETMKIKDGYLELGKKYGDYVKLNKIEKAKFLFDGYLKSKSSVINETKRCMNRVYKVSEKISLEEPRKSIVNYLKLFPVNEWVDTEQIKRMLRIKNIDFLRDYTGEVLERMEYENWYTDASFAHFETSFVDSVFMDYLATLGIVDVTLYNYYTDYGRFYLETECVRLTEFGAMVLGILTPNLKEEVSKPFTVNERYEIVIPESSKRTEYELYFERFLEKIKETPEETVYAFHFMGLAKAYDMGINPNEVIEYLKQESESVPEKLLKKATDWLKSLDKITIKTVTILEAPPEIMKILHEDQKIMSSIETSKNEHMIIKKSKSASVKKQVEENAYFCKIID